MLPDNIQNAFKEVQHKYVGETIEKLKNVKINKWFSQGDIQRNSVRIDMHFHVFSEQSKNLF
jgi:hypothetical protein